MPVSEPSYVPCSCGVRAVIDEGKHAPDCSRRLLTERDDARAEVERLREALREIVGYCEIIDTVKGRTAVEGIARSALTPYNGPCQ